MGTEAMLGLMQDWPMTVNRFLEHAARWHGQREVVSRSASGAIERTTYTALRDRAKRVSNALLASGLRPGDRVATLAMNGAAHLAVWYAIQSIGAVCHTMNPRMAAAQLAFVLEHADDRLLFADAAFAPLVREITAAGVGELRVVFLEALDEFCGTQSAECVWGDFAEHSAAGLCYTSGTTGDPKGVLYSHRSNFLHTLMVLQSDGLGITVRDCVMPVVPMYHANAWGITFAAPAVGAKLILPGARLDGESLYELIETEGVTLTAGVPTVWSSLLKFMAAAKRQPVTLKRVFVGGAACPERLIRQFADFGIEALHAWGMTEMSPVGTVGTLTPEVSTLPFQDQIPLRAKQGRPPLLVDMKIVDAAGLALPHDGVAVGTLRVKGPCTVRGYFRDPAQALDAEGFFDTGDIATIDALGYMQIVDRAKDMIKSGGEWISSLAIENEAAMHPQVAAAVAIGVPHPQWGERPLLLVVARDSAAADAAEILEFLKTRLVKWQVPDRIEFVTQLPLGPTGKVDKRALRARYAD
jgi:fatty-acyl-CoA synthase